MIQIVSLIFTKRIQKREFYNYLSIYSLLLRLALTN